MCSRFHSRLVPALRSRWRARSHRPHTPTRASCVFARIRTTCRTRAATRRGFENRIAVLLARELHATLRYTWQPQRRGFVRKSLGAGLCDVIMGVPAEFDRVLTTRPYYRSGYVLLYRPDRDHPYASLDDDRLRARRIGVQLPGNDMAETPPGEALARRGIVQNVTGYTAFGDAPAAERIVAALADNHLDVALVWGPQAGYFARRAGKPVQVVALPQDPAATPFTFAISVGVRRGATVLRDEIDQALQVVQPQIDAILAAYDVPRAEAAQWSGR